MVFLSYPDPCPVLQILPPTVSSPLLHPHTATPRVLTLDSLACMAAGPLLTSLPQSTLPFSPCFLLSHRSLSVHPATFWKGVCTAVLCFRAARRDLLPSDTMFWAHTESVIFLCPAYSTFLLSHLHPFICLHGRSAKSLLFLTSGNMSL